MNDQQQVRVHLRRARRHALPASLTLTGWRKTLADFDHACAYCREPLSRILEHFMPISRGGGTTRGNCVPACRPCNSKKGNRQPSALHGVFSGDALEEIRAYLVRVSDGPDVGILRSPEGSTHRRRLRGGPAVGIPRMGARRGIIGNGGRGMRWQGGNRGPGMLHGIANRGPGMLHGIANRGPGMRWQGIAVTVASGPGRRSLA